MPKMVNFKFRNAVLKDIRTTANYLRHRKLTKKTNVKNSNLENVKK